MAITINQAPTYPNAVYTNLVYAVSSNLVNNPQYQYVMDIRSGSGGGPVLARVRQYPNPDGSAIFDPSRIIRDYLEYDKIWQTGTTYTKAVQEFTMEFGEEYGTSPSSSVVLYDGNGNAGEPNVSDSYNDKIFSGVIDPNNGISYNWQDSGSTKILSNRPDGVPHYKPAAFAIGTYNPPSAAGSESVYWTYDGGTPTLFGTTSPNQFNNNPAPIIPTTQEELVITYDTHSLTVPLVDACNYDVINFAFINNYGVWENYSTALPIKKNTNIQRKSIIKPFVDYSSATAPYDVSRRGTKVYNTNYTDELSVSTDWLTQEEAAWLSELIESPEVYIQGDNYATWIPIQITNSSYTHNTNIRSQKAFQYEISYRYANQRQTR